MKHNKCVPWMYEYSDENRCRLCKRMIDKSNKWGVCSDCHADLEEEKRLMMQEDIDEWNSQRMADCAEACADEERKRKS